MELDEMYHMSKFKTYRNVDTGPGYGSDGWVYEHNSFLSSHIRLNKVSRRMSYPILVWVCCDAVFSRSFCTAQYDHGIARWVLVPSKSYGHIE